MPERRPAWLATILLLVILLPAGYMGSYYGMIRNKAYVTGQTSGVDRLVLPVYKADFCDSLFAPAHEIDRMARPKYWNQ